MAWKWSRIGLALTVAAGAIGLAAGKAAGGEDAGPALSAREFAALYVKLHPYRQAWTAIPWVISVSEARVRAARERKPILMIVNTGNCLGFV